MGESPVATGASSVPDHDRLFFPASAPWPRPVCTPSALATHSSPLAAPLAGSVSPEAVREPLAVAPSARGLLSPGLWRGSGRWR
ncbi:MAG: hypothetical protein AAFQ43_07270 [Bacteroidota bacterium]